MGMRREAGQTLMLYGLLWLIVYDACFVAAYVTRGRRAAAAAAARRLPLRTSHALVGQAPDGVAAARVQARRRLTHSCLLRIPSTTFIKVGK